VVGDGGNGESPWVMPSRIQGDNVRGMDLRGWKVMIGKERSRVDSGGYRDGQYDVQSSNW
jgi:hypothetical protein